MLAVYGDTGQKLTERKVVVDLTARGGLGMDRLETFDSAWEGLPARYAIVREGLNVQALWLATDLLPDEATAFGAVDDPSGLWLTTRVPLDETGTAVAGPHGFFRLCDISDRDAWMLPMIQRLRATPLLRSRGFDDGDLVEWMMPNGRWYYLQRDDGRWSLHASGNTPEARIEELVRETRPETASDFLRVVGAIALHRSEVEPERVDTQPMLLRRDGT